jgi:adenylate cyclase
MFAIVKSPFTKRQQVVYFKPVGGFKVVKLSSQIAILLIVLSTTLLMALAFPTLKQLELPAGDLLQRVRYSVMSDEERCVGAGSLCLVGIDGPTLEQLGKFQSGEWLVRRPFLHFVHAMQQHFKPRVVAFDILFQPVLGRAHQTRSHGRGELKRILEMLQAEAFEAGMDRDPLLLFKISQTISYLAEYYLAAGFAGLKWPLPETGRAGVSVLCGYYFPMAFLQKTADAPARAPLDAGRSAYLLDVAIPLENANQPPPDFPFADTIDMPAPVLLDYCRLGYINVPRDHDGIMRRLPLVWGARLPTPDGTEKRLLPSFALLAYLEYRGVGPRNVTVNFGDRVVVEAENGTPLLEIPVDEYGRMMLDFDCTLKDVPSVSLRDVLNTGTAIVSGGEGDNEQLARRRQLTQLVDGRLCLVGLVAPGTTDIGPTPIDPNTPFVQVHLTALKNMFSERLMRPLKNRERIGILLVVGLLFSLVAFLPRISTFLWGTLGFVVAYLGLCYALVHWHLMILPVSTPLLQMALAFVSILFVRYWTEERAKRRIRSMFSTMVSMEVLRYMEEHPESFALKGNRALATVMFSDINHFTTIAEKIDPDALSELLNRYFSTMTEVIMDAGGYVDKFEGDAIMAEWGVPYPDPEHAVSACRAVLVQKEALDSLVPELKNRFGEEFSVRFGLCSGELSAGNMGSQKKFQYTVMGNVVNQAARLEPLNKLYGTQIIVGPETRRLVGSAFELRHLDRVVVAGMSEPLDVFELLAEKNGVAHARLNAMRQYEEALGLYRKQRWDEAENLFKLVNDVLDDDPPSQVMLGRIRQLRDNPPGTDWDGVFVVQGKG